MPVLELRQYTLFPGRRDDLIRLFERYFVDGQEKVGIRVVGAFRDLADPQRFVWIREFPDMPAREKSLRDFYTRPVWRRHRDEANSTMVDSDNVLLLRPAWEGSAFAPVSRPAATDARALAQLGIIVLGRTVAHDDVEHFRGLVPEIEASGGVLLACLRTEHAANTFPALPVREDENVLVWLARLPMADESSELRASHVALEYIGAGWPGGIHRFETRLLQSSQRCPLSGRADGNPLTMRSTESDSQA